MGCVTLRDYTEGIKKDCDLNIVAIDGNKASRIAARGDLDKFVMCEILMTDGTKRKVAILKEEYPQIEQKILNGEEI